MEDTFQQSSIVLKMAGDYTCKDPCVWGTEPFDGSEDVQTSSLYSQSMGSPAYINNKLLFYFRFSILPHITEVPPDNAFLLFLLETIDAIF